MTLVIKPGEVKNTSSTNLSVGSKVNIGGSFKNYGKIKVFEGGRLSVSKDMLNEGDLTINDPEKIKELLIEIVRTSGNVADLGSNILKTFFGGK